MKYLFADKTQMITGGTDSFGNVVVFCKPILVFGNNEQSAIRAFLKDYPCWYYQTIGEPLDG